MQIDNAWRQLQEQIGQSAKLTKFIDESECEAFKNIGHFYTPLDIDLSKVLDPNLNDRNAIDVNSEKFEAINATI